ncbi:hypothetical protein C0993_000981 [Termitomyces sp. T159_Od127]|nr:hypothetical protein C0993_000981 [Termitomyces sp. T159_Od127]
MAAVRDAGHEIGLHGYSHENATALNIQQQKDILDHTYDLLTKFNHGVPPKGSVAPWWEVSKQDHSGMAHDCQAYYFRDEDTWTKIDYSANAQSWMKPLKRGNETGLVCIPGNWYLDDLPPMMFIKSGTNSHGWVNPRDLEEMWKDMFTYCYNNEEEFIFPITIHPDVSGLFLNIVTPPSFPEQGNFPVKVYIHGGFLQFGSPHTLGSQAQYIAAERSEVHVNIGYRISAFGFLASDKPLLRGNYGFKDQWLALEWIKANITVFGGNQDDIQISGLSAGAHSVHQLLHRASHLSQGRKAPFSSAILQSNAILTNPKTPEEYRVQFNALCHALNLDPEAADILEILRDPLKVPWSSITHVIETDILGINGTFRGCLADDWLPTSPDPLTWQRSGGLAKGLRAHGVRSVVIGDLSEEWHLYSIAHPIFTPHDIIPNLTRYFPKDVAEKFVGAWRKLSEDADIKEVEKFYGEILSCGQVHLPVRLLAEDLYKAEFPVLRYAIEWTPEQNRIEGYVTHGTDRCIWALRLPNLNPGQTAIAKHWLDKIDEEMKLIERKDKPSRDAKMVLTLNTNTEVEWKTDTHYDNFLGLKNVILPL